MKVASIVVLALLCVAIPFSPARLVADEPATTSSVAVRNSNSLLTLTSPSNYQVVQRRSRDVGTLIVRGSAPAGSTIDVRYGDQKDWTQIVARTTDSQFEASFDVNAGGWYQLEVRASLDGQVVGEAVVENVGAGEVFVVTGQSNSANYGEVKQQTQTGRVSSFNGTGWQLAVDPQPGASGRGGSMMPILGDLLVQKFDVPIGFVACGIGATSVREWLPVGVSFPNPPTIESRVEKNADGSWVSKGEAYKAFIGRLQPLGPNGFRAVLWHQGESDANQKDASRTLAGYLYRQYLAQVIHDSQRGIGWNAPWFVAQVSYHVPGDEASPDIREAQASLWRDGIALEGPDTDALKGAFRERGGLGVHFSDAGLREHANKWAEKLAPWLESNLID